MPNPGSVDVDLMIYGDLVGKWAPQIGDTIHKDGLISRWIAVITAVDGNNLLVRKAGNPRLLVLGDYTEEKIYLPNIKNSIIGSYYVIQRGTYYV